LIGAATTAYIACLGTVFTWTRFSAGQIDPMLEIPTGFFYLPVPIGSTLMALAFLQVALKRIVDVTAQPESRVSSDTGLS
jgi:TRAP-type C4-dicarboxylate transport system permease small subunit